MTGHALAVGAGTPDRYLAQTSKLAESAIAKLENVTATHFAKRIAK